MDHPSGVKVTKKTDLRLAAHSRWLSPSCSSSPWQVSWAAAAPGERPSPYPPRPSTAVAARSPPEAEGSRLGLPEPGAGKAAAHAGLCPAPPEGGKRTFSEDSAYPQCFQGGVRGQAGGGADWHSV